MKIQHLSNSSLPSLSFQEPLRSLSFFLFYFLLPKDKEIKKIIKSDKNKQNIYRVNTDIYSY